LQRSAAAANFISPFFHIYLIVIFDDMATTALSPPACLHKGCVLRRSSLYLLCALSSKTNEMSRCGSLPAKFHHNKSPLAARESLMADFVC
jgi:hypothetical protein